MDWVDQDENISEMEHAKINIIQYGIWIHQREEGCVKAHNRYVKGDTEETCQHPQARGCGHDRPL